MQPFLTRLRSLRRERFDSTTGRRRRGGIAVAASLALALFAGSGIAVAAISSASAHTPNVESDCTAVHVRALDYRADLDNTVTVRITGPGGYDHTEYRTFNANLDEWFPVPDPSIDWSYDVVIDAIDDTDDDSLPEHVKWDYGQKGTTGGCTKPTIDIGATTCVNDGDLTTVSAVLSPLDLSHSYKVSLTGTNGYSNVIDPILTDTASWSGLEPGYDYTAELVDTTTGLSATDTVHAIGCPEDPAFSITITECKAESGTPLAYGTFGVTVSSLVLGRNYVLSLINAAGGAPVDVPILSDGNPFTHNFQTAPSGTYTVRITDVADGSFKETKPVTFLPCGRTPLIVLDPTACTSTDGTSDASLFSSADQLVPGRSYAISIVSGATTVYSENLTPATSSTWTKTLLDLDPGTYTLTVTDTTDPGAVFSASSSATIKDCPTQQEIAIVPDQCAVPGGKGALTATVTNFTIGRNYVVTLTQNGLPVTGQPVSEPFDPVDAAPGVFSYQNLAPGLVYRVMVEDVTPQPATIKAAGTLPVAANDILLEDCPGNPEPFLTQPACTVYTVSQITVGLAKLIPGETYTVSVTNTADGTPVTGVPSQQVAATTPTASLQFTNLPVGRNYTVTVTNALSTLKATGTIFLKLCDLPNLAYTGASTMTPTIAGLGFLQFGLVLVGISLVRRRSGAREV